MNKEKPNYIDISKGTQALTIDPELLADILQEYKGNPANLKQRWMLFHDCLVGDLRQIIRNFERIEWEKTTTRTAEKKVNEILLRIKKAESKGKKSIKVEFPFYEVNHGIGKQFQSKMITKKTLPKTLHEFPEYGNPVLNHALNSLDTFLHGMYPKEGFSLGVWFKVVQTLLLVDYTIRLSRREIKNPKWNEDWRGILIITW